MKKVILIAAFSICSGMAINAQVSFGVKTGVNLASITGDETGDLDGRTGLHIGALVEIPISDSFSFQPELIYSMQGAKEEGSETFEGETFSFEGELKQDYLNVPLMAKYYVAEGFSVEAGPQIGLLLSAKGEFTESGGGESESGEEDFKDETSSVDFGLNFGAAYKLDMGVFFNARYNLGLSNINDFEGSDDFNQKNSVIQISVGYMF